MPTNNTRGLWRGRCIDNGEWVEGQFVPSNTNDGYRTYIIANAKWDNSDDGLDLLETDIYEVDPSTLGECTGLRDKNGKLIFEGDIVQTKHGRLCKIVWRSNSAVNCWDIVPLECKHRSPDEWDLWDSKNLLVVGNIYDNPELLKGAENNGSRS